MIDLAIGVKWLHNICHTRYVNVELHQPSVSIFSNHQVLLLNKKIDCERNINVSSDCVRELSKEGEFKSVLRDMHVWVFWVYRIGCAKQVNIPTVFLWPSLLYIRSTRLFIWLTFYFLFGQLNFLYGQLDFSYDKLFTFCMVSRTLFMANSTLDMINVLLFIWSVKLFVWLTWLFIW